MLAIVCELVVFDDYETSNERIEAKVVQEEMCGRAFALLLGGMRGLKDEDCLRDG